MTKDGGGGRVGRSRRARLSPSEGGGGLLICALVRHCLSKFIDLRRSMSRLRVDVCIGVCDRLAQTCKSEAMELKGSTRSAGRPRHVDAPRRGRAPRLPRPSGVFTQVFKSYTQICKDLQDSCHLSSSAYNLPKPPCSSSARPKQSQA